MRLSLVTETFPPDVNGVAMTLQTLAQGMQDRGHEVAIVRPKPRKCRNRRADELHVMGFPLPGYPSLQFGRPAYFTLRKHWKQTSPDVVHIATEGPLGLTALWAARSLGIVPVSSYHTNFHSYGNHYGYGFFKRQVLSYFRYFHNHSRLTFVPHHNVHKLLSENGLMNLRVLGRGVDTRLYCPQKRNPELRKAWGADDSTLVVIYVGRVAGEKNVPLSISAFREIKAAAARKGLNTRMVIVGDGPEMPLLQQMHKDIHFAGVQLGESLARCYASADAFLFASETETFGNVVTEALASGLVVVAFDYAAAQQCIRNGENGFTCPLGDAPAFIRRSLEALESLERWPQLRQAARATAENLGWRHILDVYERELLSLRPVSA